MFTEKSVGWLLLQKGLLAAKDVPMDTFQRLASDAHEFALRASKVSHPLLHPCSNLYGEGGSRPPTPLPTPSAGTTRRTAVDAAV